MYSFFFCKRIRTLRRKVEFLLVWINELHECILFSIKRVFLQKCVIHNGKNFHHFLILVLQNVFTFQTNKPKKTKKRMWREPQRKVFTLGIENKNGILTMCFNLTGNVLWFYSYENKLINAHERRHRKAHSIRTINAGKHLRHSICTCKSHIYV